MKTTNKKGFTLIELVVVIAIIGVLAAILVPSMLGYVKKSRLKSANSNAKTAYNAINGYLTDAAIKGENVNIASFAGYEWDCQTGDIGSVSGHGIPITLFRYGVPIGEEIQKQLGDNDKEAGFAAVVMMTSSGASSQSFAVQWRKTSSDNIYGQFPDPVGDVDDLNGHSYGTFLS